MNGVQTSLLNAHSGIRWITQTKFIRPIKQHQSQYLHDGQKHQPRKCKQHTEEGQASKYGEDSRNQRQIAKSLLKDYQPHTKNKIHDTWQKRLTDKNAFLRDTLVIKHQ